MLPYLAVSFHGKTNSAAMNVSSISHSTLYILDVLWGQPIKLIQVLSTSEFHGTTLILFFFAPSTQGPKKGLTDGAIMLCKLNKSL